MGKEEVRKWDRGEYKTEEKAEMNGGGVRDKVEEKCGKRREERKGWEEK